MNSSVQRGVEEAIARAERRMQLSVAKQKPGGGLVTALWQCARFGRLFHAEYREQADGTHVHTVCRQITLETMGAVANNVEIALNISSSSPRERCPLCLTWAREIEGLEGFVPCIRCGQCLRWTCLGATIGRTFRCFCGHSGSISNEPVVMHGLVQQRQAFGGDGPRFAVKRLKLTDGGTR